MPIEKKSLREISSPIRAIYQKARDVIDKNGLDYGIELLKGVVIREPGFLDARELLRNAERRKLQSMGGFSKLLAKLKVNKFTLKGKTLLSKKPAEAMAQAEEALAILLDCPSALRLLAEAGQALEADFIAVEALEILVELDPENEQNLELLAQVYELVGDGKNFLKLKQKIANMHPGDLEAAAAVRAAAAMATMEEGRWNEKDSDFRTHLKEQGAIETTIAQQGDKIVRSVADVAEMITEYEGMLQAGESSLDLLKKLAELYMRAGRFEDAIKQYDAVVEKMGNLDPAIDKAIEKANVAIGELNVKNLQEAGASEEEINAARQQIYDYKLQRYEERVRLYPNDLQLRFDLAELYWELQDIDKALEQFQLAQRNPQRRLVSIVYLGRCFGAKGQYDMAVEQMTKALKEMPTMDKDKMNALYSLGTIYEAMNRTEDAMDCFKQIYSVNVNYQDVSQRMNNYYAQKKAE